MITRPRKLSLALALCVMGAVSTVNAQPAANPAAARQLALEGVEASRRAEWTTVIDRFERAEQLFHAPVHLRFLAIGYERTNRLPEAAEMWRRLTLENLPPTAPRPFVEAVEEARRELPRAEARVGRVTINAATTPPGTAVELDGRLLDRERLGVPIYVNPGSHEVVARAEGQPTFNRRIEVTAGQNEALEVSFGATSDPGPGNVTGPGTTGPTEGPTAPRYTTVYRANPLRTVGIVVAGVGVAAAIGGVVTGLMANGAYSDLEANCPNRVCTSDQTDAAASVDTLAGMTNALLIGGGVLAAAGVVLFAVSPPRAEQVRVGVRGSTLQLSVSF